MSKRTLGQFFSTHCDVILHGIEKPSENTTIIEPFAGNGDLVKWVERNNVEEYDIEPRCQTTVQRDTLQNPPSYSNKFVITNPPYLARNKSTDKELFNKYSLNDLYKIFMEQLCNAVPLGGIVIIPVNFWSSSRFSDIALRTRFLRLFCVERVNIFEKRVFDDTSAAVCAFRFDLGESSDIVFRFDPHESSDEITIRFDETTNYTIGNEIISLKDNNYAHTVSRVLEGQSAPNTSIMLRALDNISLEWQETPFYGKKTSRTFASLNIYPPINNERQKLLIEQFNEYISKNREKYHSLFLSNYREASRKRIGFTMVYCIIQYLLSL